MLGSIISTLTVRWMCQLFTENPGLPDLMKTLSPNHPDSQSDFVAPCAAGRKGAVPGIASLWQRQLAGFSRIALFAGGLVLAVVGGGLSCQADDDGEEFTLKEFETHIRPILVTKCVKCHGEHKQEGGLRLDTREALLRGGDSGPAIVLSHSAQSLLLEAVRYEGLEMPPGGQLNDQQIQYLQRWVDAGAFWPESSGPLREGPTEVTDEDRQWWAFQPVQRPVIPKVGDDQWSVNHVDRFVLDAMRARRLTPAPKANEQSLVRRVYFDLIGLPPSVDDLQSFSDQSATLGFGAAWENLVEKLLGDPRYGEHWARFWLDVVRYAESDGWNQDAYRPQIWRYRDYVINAFNRDKPYPDFVREQLAGDEIRRDNPEHLAAAGFLRLGIYEYNQRDARGLWNDIMNEMTDVTGDAFLGLSMGCAKCHDHKFDPILQADYFRLRAFLEPVIWRDDIVGATVAEKEAYAQQLTQWEEATESIRRQIDALTRPYIDRKWKSTVDKFPLDIQACFNKPIAERTSWEHQMAYLVSRQFEEEGGGPLKSMKKEDKAQYDLLQKELAAFDNIKPKPLPLLMTVTDFDGAVAPTVIPDTADAEPIVPGYLTVMVPANKSPVAAPEALPDSTGRRTELAEWIGDGHNPLTMRVMVNRIWQQHFGRGIVATPSDFGHLGLAPTHPELLDWLVTEFVEHNFSMKHLHRLILSSSTWQQSAHHPDASDYQQIDPADSFLWRTRIRRLSAEQIRDAMLMCSGELDQKRGGPSVESKVPRRAIYVKSFRNTPDPFMSAFDIANGLQSTSERTATTTPVQSLLMINGDYPLGRAKKFAERIARMYSTPEEQLNYAFEMAWGRRPTQAELNWSLQFLTSDCTSPGEVQFADSSAEQGGEELEREPETAIRQTEEVQRQRLIDFCHVIFNSNEFLYIE